MGEWNSSLVLVGFMVVSGCVDTSEVVDSFELCQHSHNDDGREARSELR